MYPAVSGPVQPAAVRAGVRGARRPRVVHVPQRVPVPRWPLPEEDPALLCWWGSIFIFKKNTYTDFGVPSTKIIAMLIVIKQRRDDLNVYNVGWFHVAQYRESWMDLGKALTQQWATVS